MANILDSSKLTKSAKPATAAEWFVMNKQQGQPEQGTGMDMDAFAQLVKLIAAMLEQQRQPEQQQQEDKTNFAERMNVDMNNVGKPKTTKSDVWAAIEKAAGQIQQQRPELSQAQAVTKFLESDAGASLYKLYKQIQ